MTLHLAATIRWHAPFWAMKPFRVICSHEQDEHLYHFVPLSTTLDVSYS